MKWLFTILLLGSLYGQGFGYNYIDPEACIDCGACEPECPVEAIYDEDDLPEEYQKYIEINAKFFEEN